VRLPFNGSYPVTQPFGVNPANYAQFGMKGHNGIDYGLPTGTPVVATIAGVAHVLSDPLGFGNYVTVTNGQYKTIYAHLKNALVLNGQQVVTGQAIGISNNTGNSSGPHLHFGVKPVNPDNNNGYFGAIDPQPLLNQGDEMYNGKTAEQWYKDWKGEHDINVIREDYLNRIAYAAGDDLDPVEGDDVDRIITKIDAKNKQIEILTKQLEALGGAVSTLESGIYRVK
jgi:hypothetical protein